MKKKIIAAMLLMSITLLCAAPAFAFRFPEPDWGALLREKENMVNETDFELYAEATSGHAPYYGARLEPRSGAYLGMIAETSDEFRPLSSYLTYIDNMNQPDLYYPANQMIENDDVVTMVGWTIHSLDMVDIDHVRNVLNTLSSYNKPMFIRFANEMNTDGIGDDPTRYVDTFRAVANVVHEYPNFAMVWSPIDLGSLDRPFEYYYPGDEYVDWVGVSCYSLRYFQGNPNTTYKDSVYFMTGDYAWATNRVKPILKFMSDNNIQKPVMISEGGVTTATNHGPVEESWVAPRLRNMLWSVIMKYPQIKMINYFNIDRPDEAVRYPISGYSYASDIFKEAAQCDAYLHSASDTADFVFRPANNAGTLAAKDGLVRLYTLAYMPKNPNITVNYYIDGTWKHSANQIPYIYNLDITALADGEHSLKISASGSEKSYTFYKRGGAIRFGGEPEYMPATPTTTSAPTAPAAQTISVTLNGEKLIFDQNPVMESDRVLVPMRKIFEALGAYVDWDSAYRTAIAARYGKTIYVKIDCPYMIIDSMGLLDPHIAAMLMSRETDPDRLPNYIDSLVAENIRTPLLDVPARLIGDRTLVPVRAVSEAFDCQVDWDDASQTVIINK